MNHRWAPAVCTLIIVNALGGCRGEEEPRQAVEIPWTDPAPALILIHGYGDNAHVFDDLAPAFTDRFRVVAYTRRGHGRSEAKDRIEAYVRDQVEVQPDGSVRAALRDSVAQAVFAVLLTDRRDYTKVRAPALAIYTESFFDVNHPDSVQRAKNLRWEQKYFAPFRVASVERIRRELRNPEILIVPGTHGDFVFTSRDRVVEAMRRFLLTEAK